MFNGKNKKNNAYPCKPQFYNIKVRCKGVFITRTGNHDDLFQFRFQNSVLVLIVSATGHLLLFEVSRNRMVYSLSTSWNGVIVQNGKTSYKTASKTCLHLYLILSHIILNDPCMILHTIFRNDIRFQSILEVYERPPCNIENSLRKL